MTPSNSLAARARRLAACVVLLGLAAVCAHADERPELYVAVAANFAGTANSLVPHFERLHDVEVTLVVASTGALYAQIAGGAPYDVLLAADAARPARLVDAGLGVDASRFTYAVGALVAWSASPAIRGDCRAALGPSAAGRVAIANPRTAPYGAAARDVLMRLGAWPGPPGRIVTAGNVMQALSFAATGNVDVALTARSLVTLPTLPRAVCQWVVPAAWHAPIQQQAVRLTGAGSPSLAQAFLDWLRSPGIRDRIARAGYRLP